ncbi:uncharacterized protein PHACADRAFT_206470 [Phanerochaete carnosa HHB-10118-sp]|uniref:DUF6533 domain-containing protein n=1 Tax=Phanerochaete carnosa (strain HHB-10118-sp) TaxID=650164 RepID=K5WES6_PHACS|nr:uncharacterized protein PHACADRAFT_206470 [Phanerochaete carnosa HHB-10118-sp]EKM57574.1 hypothetical protein PHACADRAFT_206470 [Phanerochaete carnosa HHB-10118-sp]
MSSDLASEVSQIIVARSALIAASVLVFHDYLTTLDQEVRTVWQQKLSAVSLLIVSTRWMLLLQAMFALFTLIPHGKLKVLRAMSSCEATFWMSTIIGLATPAQTAVFSALRVCAMWNRNYVLFTIVLVLSLPQEIINVYALADSSFEYFPPPIDACVNFFNYSDEVNDACMFSPTCPLFLLFVTRIPLIVADLLVLVLTWMKTYRQYREARALNIKSPLTTYFIHDGTIYFIVLLILNISQIVSFFFTSIGILAPFTSIMPQILVCRFMMNLRLLSHGSSTTSEDESSRQLASLRMLTFNENATPSFMGNMGEPLDYGHWQDDSLRVDDDVRVNDERPYFGEEPEV